MVDINKDVVETPEDSKETQMIRVKEQIKLVSDKIDLFNKMEEIYSRIMQIKKDNYKIVGDKPGYYYLDEYSKLSLEYEELRYSIEKTNNSHLIESEKMLLQKLNDRLEELQNE